MSETKSFIKRGYKPQGVAAVSHRTGHLAFLDGTRVYGIVRDPYDYDFGPVLMPTLKSLDVKIGDASLIRKCVDIQDWKTEEVFTVEFALGNVLNEGAEKAPASAKSIAQLAQEFMRTVEERFAADGKDVEGCAVAIFIGEDIAPGVMQGYSGVFGDQRRIFKTIENSLRKHPKLAGWISAAALAARFGKQL